VEKRAVVLDQLVKAVRKHGKGKRKEGAAKTRAQHGGASDAGVVGEGGGSSSLGDVSSSVGNEGGGDANEGGVIANEVVVGIEQPLRSFAHCLV
jgi:hypothetical protein